MSRSGWGIVTRSLHTGLVQRAGRLQCRLVADRVPVVRLVVVLCRSVALPMEVVGGGMQLCALCCAVLHWSHVVPVPVCPADCMWMGLQVYIGRVGVQDLCSYWGSREYL